MRNSNFIFVLMGLLLCSCGSKEVVERVDTFFTPDEYKIVQPVVDTTKMLTLEELPIEVFGAKKIAVKDSLLFTTTTNEKAFGSIVNLNTNNIVAQVAPLGRGPGDFNILLTPKQFWYNENGELIVNAYDSRALKPINITKSIEDKGSFVEYDKKFSDIYKYEQGFADRIALKLGNEEYFIFQNISYRDARENKFFPARYIIKTPNEQYDFDIYKDVPTSEDDEMLPTKLEGRIVLIKPDCRKVVDISGPLDYINIINIEQRKVTSIIEPTTPCYDKLGNMDLFTNLKNGVLDADVTDKHILILYDGRTRDDIIAKKQATISLRVYDWNGNFIRAAKLPQMIINQMAVDGENNIAYFLNRHEEKFYRCDLSELLK